MEKVDFEKEKEKNEKKTCLSDEVQRSFHSFRSLSPHLGNRFLRLRAVIDITSSASVKHTQLDDDERVLVGYSISAGARNM